MSLESVTVRRVNHRTGEVVEMVGEQEIAEGMMAVLERERGEPDEDAVDGEEFDAAVQRVVTAKRRSEAAKTAAKEAKEELATAWMALLELKGPAEGFETGKKPRQLRFQAEG